VKYSETEGRECQDLKSRRRVERKKDDETRLCDRAGTNQHRGGKLKGEALRPHRLGGVIGHKSKGYREKREIKRGLRMAISYARLRFMQARNGGMEI